MFKGASTTLSMNLHHLLNSLDHGNLSSYHHKNVHNSVDELDLWNFRRLSALSGSRESVVASQPAYPRPVKLNLRNFDCPLGCRDDWYLALPHIHTTGTSTVRCCTRSCGAHMLGGTETSTSCGANFTTAVVSSKIWHIGTSMDCSTRCVPGLSPATPSSYVRVQTIADLSVLYDGIVVVIKIGILFGRGKVFRSSTRLVSIFSC